MAVDTRCCRPLTGAELWSGKCPPAILVDSYRFVGRGTHATLTVGVFLALLAEGGG